MFGGLVPRYSILVCAIVLSGCATVRDFREKPRDPESLLRYLHENIQFAFTRIESDLDGTARMLERTGPTGGAARELLEGLSIRHPAVSAAFSARLDGTIITSEPIPHRKPASQPDDFEVRVLAALSGAPGLHPIGSAHVLWQPIPAFGEFGETRMGVVVALADAFDEVYAAPDIGEPVDIWMADPAGTVVADLDGNELGQNVLSENAYAIHDGMSRVLRAIVDRRSGREQYTYFGPSFIVVKEAGWDTVQLGGKEWRLVVEHVVEGDSANVARLTHSFTPITYQEVVNGIVMDPRLAYAASEGRPAGVQRVLHEYYDRYPGLYNVQWMDANGVTQCGYPPSRSLDEYDHRTGMRPGDDWLLDVLDAGTTFHHAGRMTDGYEGELFAAPLRRGGVSWGMIYAIRRADGM